MRTFIDYLLVLLLVWVVAYLCTPQQVERFIGGSPLDVLAHAVRSLR